jgi:hypothetical protein
VAAKVGIVAGTIAAALVLALPAFGGTGGTGGGTGSGGAGSAAGNPFHGNGMWIWYLNRSEGGKVRHIARRAHHHGIRTVFIKSSDGTYPWRQFTSHLVDALHARNLRVCAWQYIYGTYPRHEAKLGAAAVRKGADCLVIDAESEFEGRYSAATVYVQKLRSLIGRRFPVALASFPYVDYHPGFPYSVFLGRRGAQYDLPQVYWKAIGTTVGQAYTHTFTYNRVYRRPIMPVGQTYGSPSLKDLTSFRRHAKSYGLAGVSWWDWQETSKPEWRRLGGAVSKLDGVNRPSAYPFLQYGSHGDLVVWAQECLRAAGFSVPVTGNFGDITRRAVRHFQTRAGIAVDGKIGATTWKHLLRHRGIWVNWHHSGGVGKRAAGRSAPGSAGLPPTRDEIPAPPHRGT